MVTVETTQLTHPPVRLTAAEVAKILQGVQSTGQLYGFTSLQISVFGSRADMTARGGDLDLYVKLERTGSVTLHEIYRRIKVALTDLIGEQKIDIVLDDGVASIGAFSEVIQKTKVDLWIKT